MQNSCDFSEICKLGSVKFSVAEVIFSLFGLFKLQLTLRSLKMTKQCGHSLGDCWNNIVKTMWLRIEMLDI